MGGGWAYQPMVFLGDGSSLGAATAPDASVVKLLLLSADGGEQTLRTLRQSDAVQFGGTVTDGRRIAWLEQTAGDDGALTIQSDDVRYTILLRRVDYLKRFARESRVGFGAASGA